MEKTFIAFISLGFACGGPEMGDYGEFTVELSEDELLKIDEIIKEDTRGHYKRTVLEERYPDIHDKIVEAAQDLARDVIVHDAVAVVGVSLSAKDNKRLKAMNYHEQANYLAAQYDLEPETLDGAEVCYYLSDGELPRDFKKSN